MAIEIHKWEKILTIYLKIIMGIFAIIAFFRREYVWTIGIFFSIYLTLLPTILKRDFNVKIPLILDISITISIFLHIIGGYLGLYFTIPFYDHITHFISSTTVSLIAVIVLYVLAFHLKLVKLPPIGFGVFTVLFAMGMGVIWELMEWAFDVIAGTNLQISLNNTMWDLSFDTLAGTIVGIVAIMKLKRGEALDREAVIDIRDLRKSIGYKRWQLIFSGNQGIKKALARSFRDHKLLEKFVDTVMEESRHIRQRERNLWKKMRGNKNDSRNPKKKKTSQKPKKK
jgi:uncharacterized membrane protein YjdF